MVSTFAVVVDGVTRFYGNNKVIDNLSFRVKKGSVHGFLGPNGAGKTTSMKMICGVIPPSSGEISVTTKKIGMLLENPPLFSDMLVGDYLKYVCQIHGVSKKQISEYVNDAIEKLHLEKVQNRLIRNLSKGYKQRVGVAQAIVFKPELVVLDEPTIGLDPESVIEMRHFILQIAKNHTVLISSHLLHEIELICDEVTIINHGKIIASDSIENIKSLSKHLDTVDIRFSGDSTVLEKNLRQLEFVDKLTFNKNVCQISMNAQDANLAALYEKIKDSDIILLELRKKKNNLEDSFLSILKERV
jgi:ABC-2 type transport system ATP-binding protein